MPPLPPTAVVLITGASSGIGRATAELLASRGFRVFGASRRPPSPPLTGIREEWISMDVRDEAAARAGVSAVVAQAGRLDAVVCAAGYGVFGSVEDLPIEKARAQMETNVIGTLTVLRAALSHLRRAQGRAVVVGSLAGRAPIPFQSHYSASKAALDALTLALRIEVAPLGVGVSLVEPGDIQTPFNENMDWGGGGEPAYAERRRACEQVIRESLPKAPGPEVVADVILRALTARRPRVRYTVGPDSLFVPMGRRLLPDWLSLSLIRDHFKV
ncbi:MAG TPA: SDR family oxidoreductase [Vicinamibacteria bacterium]|nr:SDR family oxidoreductase [Vicinamibacteria bacterium]